MLKTIIDTGPIVAFFDEGDKYDNKERQLDFIEWIKDGAISVVDISGDDFALVHKYMKKYADTPMDFADASLVILAHKLGTKSILTLDSDFSVYRTIEGKKFDNILKGILV